MKIRKSLIGYRQKTVDKLVKDYEDKIQKLNEDNEYLREKLEETKFMYQTAKAEYEKKIDELLIKDENSNVDYFYQKALKASETLMQNTVNSINDAKEKYESVIHDVEKEQQSVEDKFYELVELIGNIQIHIKDMNEKAICIKNTTSKIDTIKKEATEEFEKITRSFNKKTGSIKREINNTKSSRISFADFLESYTGEGSIVEILKLYSDLYS